MFSPLRNGIMAEGWLVLTRTILSFYDRDPRGVTRKPISRFVLNKPGMVYVVITSVTRARLPNATSTALLNAFGLEIFSSVTCSELYWAAPSLQSKIDWVEELQKILGLQGSLTCGGEKGGAGKRKRDREDTHEEVSKPALGESNKVKDLCKQSRRELKEVTIVPLHTPPKVSRTKEDSNIVKTDFTAERHSAMSTPIQSQSALNYSDSINISIHSSMLNTSSDSSYI